VSGLRVAHSFDVWLPLTMTWAATQVHAANVDLAIVLADATENLDAFPHSPLYTVTGPREAAAVRAARRAHRRAYPRSYRRALRSHRPQILHSHFGYRGWADLPLARRSEVAHVVTFYGQDVTMYPRRWPVWRRRYAELFAAADLVLCEGPYMASSIVALGCPQNRVQVQRLGVDLTRLPCRPRSLGANETPRVLIAGAFRPKKGITAALRAVAAARGAGRRVSVTIVGGSNGGPVEEEERRRIDETVREMRLDDAVTFTGMIPYERLLNEIARHHVFLSPSVTAPDGDSEGGAPVTIIEAAASGMPVVSTAHCDIPEVVEDGVTGLLAPEGDQAALDALLCRLLSHPESWPEMGAAAGEFVRRRFDSRACAAELVRRYRALVED